MECTKCGQHKTEDCFEIRSDNGVRRHRRVCKRCRTDSVVARRAENPEAFRSAERSRYAKNKAQHSKKWAAYYAINKGRLLAQAKIRRSKKKPTLAKYARERRSDPLVRYVENLRRRIFSYYQGKQSDSTMRLVGCSRSDLINHLEKTKQGQAPYEIDHILPIASFDHSDPTQRAVCWSYMNLRLIPRAENRQKSAKMPHGHQSLYETILRSVIASQETYGRAA